MQTLTYQWVTPHKIISLEYYFDWRNNYCIFIDGNLKYQTCDENLAYHVYNNWLRMYGC